MKRTLQKHILIVDDEEDILELVKYNLEINGFQTTCVTNGEQALKKASIHHPDLIVLDLMLPNIDGLNVCRILKGDTETKSIPILMLTARGEETDIVKGLEIGADDYVTKPFSPQVLVARVKALLRRYSESVADENGVITIHDLTIHPEKREVKIGERLIEFTYTEFQILHLLSSRPNIVFTRYQIIDAVRGDNYPVTDRTVDFQIVGLRKKLGKAGRFIKTVRGVGYRFYLEE
ncbi:MAG: response regulator [Candidatus Marinimicrobia bacterium]|nr:response regulator [Candidatus Neomarinimicrobiota bacterium]